MPYAKKSLKYINSSINRTVSIRNNNLMGSGKVIRKKREPLKNAKKRIWKLKFLFLLHFEGFPLVHCQPLFFMFCRWIPRLLPPMTFLARLGSLSERQKFRIAKKVGIGNFSAPKLQISLCQTKLWLDWH